MRADTAGDVVGRRERENGELGQSGRFEPSPHTRHAMAGDCYSRKDAINKQQTAVPVNLPSVGISSCFTLNIWFISVVDKRSSMSQPENFDNLVVWGIWG